MLINQEEGGKIESYYFFKVHNALKIIEETATATYCDPDEAYQAAEISMGILKDFGKFILKIKEEEFKKSAKDRVMERIRRGSDFE